MLSGNRLSEYENKIGTFSQPGIALVGALATLNCRASGVAPFRVASPGRRFERAKTPPGNARLRRAGRGCASEI